MKKTLSSFLHAVFTTLVLLFLTEQHILAQKGFDLKKRNPTENQVEQPNVDFQKVKGENPEKNARVSIETSTLSTKLLKLKVSKDPETGGVLMIENLSKAKPNARVSIQTLANDFLKETKNLLQIENPSQELEIVGMESDDVGMTHFRIQQKYKNVPVFGGEILLHSQGEKIDVLNGRNFPTPKLNSVEPSISSEKAIQLALQDVSKYAIVQKNGVMGKLLGKEGNKSELVIFHKDEKPDNEHLTYYLTIKPNIMERWIYFVDANSGEILDKYNYTCALDGPFTARANDLNGVQRTLNIQQVGNSYFLIDTQRPMFNKASKLPDDPIGAIWTIDARNTRVDNTQYQQISSTNGTSWSPGAVSAHYNAGICYDYYRSKFTRNSLDGKGSSIISVINITDEDGKGFDNAFWNGEYMGYGNGSQAFKPLAGGLDVAGHEMTHGVVESTARLEYRNQSGALNESFADIFGAMIDRDDWLLGEDIVNKSVFTTGAMRSLENPNQGLGKNGNGYQPKNMSQYQYLPDTEQGDNGGVHVNSGIPNHTFYLFATANGIGKDIAERVYYRALTTYLTRTSKFIDARLAVIKSATDLYPSNAAVANAARAAFDAVGITDATGTPTQTKQEIPTNTGGDFIIVYEPSSGKLYTGKTTDTQYRAISSKGCKAKPSVTDDGQFAYFVGTDKNIYRIQLSGNYTESKLTSDAFWGNVAVSKDGKKLAARADKQEKKIYVFNLEDGKYKEFTLYNPTYSAGVKTGEVLYPDSFEWDYSGEYLMYDALNSLKSVTSNYEFWDVGLLRAWDNSKKTFGDGIIEKLFTDLEEGESIGNPSFAKNSPTVVAFDYFDELDDPNSYYQIAIDIEEGDVGAIFQNTEIGYPGYSRQDNLMLFNTKTNGKETVSRINLQSNKLNPTGSASVLFNDAKWAVWYSQGQRSLPTKTDQTINFASITDKNPNTNFNISATASSNLSVQYSVESGDATISGNQVRTGSTPGKVVLKAFQVGNNQFNSVSANQTFCIVPPTPSITRNGNNLVATGGSNYQWFVNGNIIGGQTTSNTRIPDISGSWTVRNYTSDGCFSPVSNAISIEIVLANEPNNDLKISFYPNPTSDELKIELPNQTTFKEASFYTIEGKEMLKFNKLSENNTLNISQLQKGSYLLSVETNKGKMSRRVVRE